MRPMIRSAGLLLLATALASGCAATQAKPNTAPSLGRTSAPVDYGLRVFTPTAESNVPEMLDALAKADYVLVGETHLDYQTHRMEQTILEGILERRGAEATVLSMEMFTRDQQDALDGYLGGALDEATFLEQAPPWSNYRTAYRPLVETAKASGVPVIGANLPRELQREFGMKKGAALDGLTPEQRAWVPAEIFPPAESYWARIEARLRDAGHGHMGAMDVAGRTWSVQNLWDNTMADAMVKARRANPKVGVVHVVGGFHAEYGDGIANQLRRRDPRATIAIVAIDPVYDLRGLEPSDVGARADFVVFALADARDLNDGTLGVTVSDELKYRLSAPAVGEPKGLLVWLGEDETSAADALTHWKTALGDEVMVAVLEQPHRVITDDARVSGRWTWPDSYGADAGRVVAGIDRLAAYLGHRWQIPEAKVVVAGRGSGADVALWSGLYGDAPRTVIAIDPPNPRRLAEAGLPSQLPESRTVVIVGEPAAMEAAVRTLHLAKIEAAARTRVSAEAEIRAALGLPPQDLDGDAVELRIDVDTPIARQWAGLHARLAERDGTPRTVVVDPTKPPTLNVDPASFTDGEGLPLAPGPFGGTTILVLPPKLTPKVRDAWKALGEGDVLKKRSRFATLVVVTEAELGPKLDALREQGKRSMLIVPAAFAVTPARMDAIRALVVGHDQELDVHYLPGLGGSWASALAGAHAGA